MEARKQAICDALRAFIEQRPGFEFANYGDVSAYRSDQRRVQRQLHDARTLLRQVELSEGITADAMLNAADGRVQITVRDTVHGKPGPWYGVDYCAGQYFPMEFRAGVARYLASLLWDYKREHCMPAPSYNESMEQVYTLCDGSQPLRHVSGGDWLRASFRRDYGRGVASRYFN